MTQKANTRAWVTKYALTQGILEVDGHINETFKDMLCYGNQYAHGNEWHLTREAAVARAEEMRLAKITSIEKSLAKLKKMKIEIVQTK